MYIHVYLFFLLSACPARAVSCKRGVSRGRGVSRKRSVSRRRGVSRGRSLNEIPEHHSPIGSMRITPNCTIDDIASMQPSSSVKS